VAQYLEAAAAIADGLNFEEEYNNSLECIYNFIELNIRLNTAFEALFTINEH